MLTQHSCRLVPAVSILLCGCWSGLPLLPEEIPAAVLAVDADHAGFMEDGHPLAEVAVGTVIDDLSLLEGCWGRFEIESVEASESQEAWELERVEVWAFDTANHRIWMYRLFRSAAFTTHPWMGFPETLGVEVAEYSVLDDNRIERRYVDGQAGAINERGEIVFYPGALIAAGFNIGLELESRVTLQGDFMMLDDGFIDLPPDGTAVTLWRRLPLCDAP